MALFGVIALVTIVGAGWFSKRLGVAAPLILIVIGVGFSFIPGAPTTVPHEVVLFGLLPLILYAAAIQVPIVDFRRNLSSITALSVVLVLVTSFATGFILYMVFPALTLAGGIAIGAVISPTDAVAATALGKKLGLPPRLVTILEGEGLVNDATALVLLRSAVAATAMSIDLWAVALDFAFAVLFAIIVGLVVGVCTVWVRSKLRDPLLDTAISFAVPFIAFIPAEFANASGVIAVVTAGLYSGHHGARRFSAQARISERLNWRTVQFIVENGVFLLMGIEISAIIVGVHRDDLSVDTAIYLGLFMTAVVILIRFAFIPPLLWSLRRRQRHTVRRQARWRRIMDTFTKRELPEKSSRLGAPSRAGLDRAEARYQRRETDLAQLQAEGLGWRGGVILGWSGMRGVVTLAAAQSLPESIPYRAQLVLIAFTVAIATLLLQGSTLPWVIRGTGIRGSDDVADRRELASLLDELGAAGVDALESSDLLVGHGEQLDHAVIERVRNDTLLAVQSAWERVEFAQGGDGALKSPEWLYRALRRQVISAEREALLEARADGRYPSRILAAAQSMLDLEETRLEQLDKP